MSLDSTFFYGPITVAQITEASVARNVSWFITMYEEKFLRLLLGDDLYEAYKAGIAVEPTPDAKWTDLDAKLYKVSGSVKISPVANYVYWFYQRNEVTTTTGTGEKKPDGENAMTVSSQPKVKLVWNSMVEMNRGIILWLNEHTADYADWTDWSGVWPYCQWPQGQSYERMDLLKRIGL